MMMDDKDYEAKQDCKALLEAEAIKQDSKRMAAAIKMVKMKKKLITSVEQLKGVAMKYEKDSYKKDMDSKKDMSYKKDMKSHNSKGSY